MANKVVQIKKYRYKLITSYIGADGKRHRITSATRLYTKSKGLNKEAIAALAKKKGLDVAELDETIKRFAKKGDATNSQKILSYFADNRVSRYLGNFGIDVKELTSELQMICPEVTYEWVIDDAHWTVKGVYKIDGPLLLPSGQRVDFVWSYNEGALWQVRGE